MATGGGGRHLIVFETMSDNASDGTYVDVRIFLALASDAPWARLSLRWPPDKDAAVDDKLLPNTGETDVNDIGIC